MLAILCVSASVFFWYSGSGRKCVEQIYQEDFLRPKLDFNSTSAALIVAVTTGLACGGLVRAYGSGAV